MRIRDLDKLKLILQFYLRPILFTASASQKKYRTHEKVTQK